MAAILPLNLNTPELIIRGAMREAYLLEKGQNPDSEDYADYLARLNALVQVWQTLGIKLFLWHDTPIVLTAGQQAYSITTAVGPNSLLTNPLQARECWYVQSGGAQYPLTPFSWNEWELLSNKSATGQPVNYFLDKQATTFSINLWPIPDTNGAQGTAHVLVRQRVAQMLQINEQTMFPSEWFLALVWGLAAEICTAQPAAIIKRCTEMAAFYKETLEGFDVEDNTVTGFQVNQQIGYARARFR